MTTQTNALACAGLAALAACATDTYAPRIPTKDSAQERIDAGPRQGSVWGAEQRDPGEQPIAGFCEALLALQPAPQAVACLPLVTYDLRSTGPWVSELGVEIADRVAGELGGRGMPGRALATNEVGLLLARGNLARSSLSTLEAVDRNAGRIGTDVIVFGTVRRRDRAGAQDLDLLTIELLAYRANGGRIAVSTRWDVPSDDLAYRRIWHLAQSESPWLPDSRWGQPLFAPNLAAELRRMSEELVAGAAFDARSGEGAVHVAPLDTSGYVRSLARLRAAQSSYAAEYARRADAAQAKSAELDRASPIVLNGTEFPDLQSAEDFLITLAENLDATEAARFGETFSGILAQALMQRSPAARVQPPAYARRGDAALVAGVVSQGGLARNASAREALRAAGIAFVVAPRLEQVGDSWQIRVEVHDLAQNSLASAATAGVPAALVGELQRALGSETLEPVGAAQSASGPWERVWSSTKSGVVEVGGPSAHGSGFFVREDGLVLTNEHVVRAAGTPLQVRTADGARLEARVVAQDPERDLAALSTGSLPQGAHVFTFAESVSVGTEVAVLGHPRQSAGWVLTPGHVSSTSEQFASASGNPQPALMYTCPTRQGSSGSPVLLADGRVAAVHCAGRAGELMGAAGQALGGAGAVTELTGFALGIPAGAAREFVAGLPTP